LAQRIVEAAPPVGETSGSEVGLVGAREKVGHKQDPADETQAVPSVAQHGAQITGEWLDSEYAASATT
jgi:hypothetical protein